MAIFSGSLPADSLAGSYPATYVVNQTPATNPIAYTACLPPRNSACTELSITITPIDHYTIRVTFAFGVITNRALLDPLNYIFTPSLIVCSVTPNDPVEASYVDLEVQGMTNQAYSLSIQTIETA